MAHKVIEVQILSELADRTIKSVSVYRMKAPPWSPWVSCKYDLVEIVFDDDKVASFRTSDAQRYSSRVVFTMENQ